MSVRVTAQNEGHIRGVGRHLLYYRSWEVPDPRSALILLHGTFEHSGRYRELGSAMAGYGFSTYALDMRGHGASDGRRGHVQRFDVLLQDLDRFRREVQGLAPQGIPVFLIGHCLGGLVALRYVEEYDAPLAGAVITAPWLGTAVRLPRRQVLLANLLDRVLPAFPFRFPLDPGTLTHDRAMVAGYRDDPHIHRIITPRMFTESASAIQMAIQRGNRIHVPVHFILAGDDRLVDTSRSLALARSLPADAVTVEVLDGWHHDMLHEVERSWLMARIRDWVEARIARLV